MHRKPGKQFQQSGNNRTAPCFTPTASATPTTVYIPEGEKDVLAVEAVGGAAVCSAMGAGNAHNADWSPLTGRNIIIVADKDEAGRKHATETAQLLNGIAASVRIAEAKTGNDIADHIAAGYTLDELVNTFERRHAEAMARNRSQTRRAAPLARHNRIPRAAVTLLIGDEGIGKVLLWVWIVAAVTTGKPLPEFGIPAREPAPVIIAAITEDAGRPPCGHGWRSPAPTST